MRTIAKPILALMLASTMLSGCALVAGGVAGGVAGSELEEDDGKFDPGENTELGKEIYD